MSSENKRRMAIADALHGGAIKLLRMVRVEDAASGIGPAMRIDALRLLEIRNWLQAKVLPRAARHA